MQQTSEHDQDWHDVHKHKRFHQTITFTSAGLVLGHGTSILPAEKNAFGDATVRLGGEEPRILALLTATYGQPVAPAIVSKMRRAVDYWNRGEKALSQIHLRCLICHDWMKGRLIVFFSRTSLFDAGLRLRT